MFKNLPRGTKISINRSIRIAFEQYMSRIEWNEKHYDIEEFIHQWKQYIEVNAAWFKQLDDRTKNAPVFHEELAEKINDIVKKTLMEPPTEEQVQQLESVLASKGLSDITYSCKAEAKFWIEKLTDKQW